MQQVKSEVALEHRVNNSKRPSVIKYLTVNSAQPIENYISEVISYITS